jgi:hypothetical protein
MMSTATSEIATTRENYEKLSKERLITACKAFNIQAPGGNGFSKANKQQLVDALVASGGSGSESTQEESNGSGSESNGSNGKPVVKAKAPKKARAKKAKAKAKAVKVKPASKPSTRRRRTPEEIIAAKEAKLKAAEKKLAERKAKEEARIAKIEERIAKRTYQYGTDEETGQKWMKKVCPATGEWAEDDDPRYLEVITDGLVGKAARDALEAAYGDNSIYRVFGFRLIKQRCPVTGEVKRLYAPQPWCRAARRAASAATAQKKRDVKNVAKAAKKAAHDAEVWGTDEGEGTTGGEE